MPRQMYSGIRSYDLIVAGIGLITSCRIIPDSDMDCPELWWKKMKSLVSLLWTWDSCARAAKAFEPHLRCC